MEIHHTQVSDAQLRPAGKAQFLAMRSSISPAHTGSEIDLGGKYPGIMRSAPEIDSRNHATQVRHAAAAGEPDFWCIIGTNDRVVHIPESINLRTAKGEGVVTCALRPGPEIER